MPSMITNLAGVRFAVYGLVVNC